MSDRINSDIAITEIPPHLMPSALRDYGARGYTMGECKILVTIEPRKQHGVVRRCHHLSISCRDRDPTWAEIATARYRILPDNIIVVMVLPPIDLYVNVHEHTFHLIEQGEMP